MPLSLFLLKPVKQVTEYPLLMEKLLKQSSADHPTFIVVICSVEDPGCLSRIPDPDFYPSRIQDPGSGSLIQKQQ
jgi:hypothetical protein